jgi:hypothetical protein
MVQASHGRRSRRGRAPVAFGARVLV